MGRQRRALRVQDFRVDERRRQRRCRERKRGAATGPPSPCHAPASECESRDLKAIVLESLDRAMAMSRASLERRMAAILRDFGTDSGAGQTVTGELSRASLGSQVPEAP